MNRHASASAGRVAATARPMSTSLPARDSCTLDRVTDAGPQNTFLT